MQHFAIDLGGTESQICVRDPSGRILREGKARTRSLPKILEQEARSRVILETCSEAFAIADAALHSGHEVRVVPATLVKTLGVGARRIKTDQRDARALSEVSTRIDLPSVHVPSTVSREWKSICGMREELVRCRTALINSVRGWARGRLLKIRTGEVTTFPQRVLDAALQSDEGVPMYVQRLLDSVEQLNIEIADAEREINGLAEDNVVCARLMSIPGVGPITSLRFVASLDEISRFGSAAAVQSFLGLTPGEHSSSERKHRTGITKAGPGEVRRALVQAAWNIRRLRPQDPIVVWAASVEQRRGKFVATVALARKLAGILFAMWRDGTTYQPQ